MLAYLSRASLRSPASHGFYRFFAWTCFAALFCKNLEVWFQDPLSWCQLISWFLLLISLVPLALGSQALVRRGKPVWYRQEESDLLWFENITTLVTTGIFRFIRHPIYSSLLWLAWGLFFKAPDLTGCLLGIVAAIFLFFTVRSEETERIRFFGPIYLEYIKKTKMFLPFVFCHKKKTCRHFSGRQVIEANFYPVFNRTYAGWWCSCGIYPRRNRELLLYPDKTLAPGRN